MPCIASMYPRNSPAFAYATGEMSTTHSRSTSSGCRRASTIAALPPIE